MSELKLSYSGYVCAPYLHNRDSLELKESWSSSKNIEKLYFVTGTFSSDSQPYFSTSANHYLLAKFKDSSIVEKELSIEMSNLMLVHKGKPIKVGTSIDKKGKKVRINRKNGNLID